MACHVWFAICIAVFLPGIWSEKSRKWRILDMKLNLLRDEIPRLKLDITDLRTELELERARTDDLTSTLNDREYDSGDSTGATNDATELHKQLKTQSVRILELERSVDNLQQANAVEDNSKTAVKVMENFAKSIKLAFKSEKLRLRNITDELHLKSNDVQQEAVRDMNKTIQAIIGQVKELANSTRAKLTDLQLAVDADKLGPCCLSDSDDRTCKTKEFDCGDNVCVAQARVCDGHVDYDSGKGEQACANPVSATCECENGGTCVRDRDCRCMAGYAGALCEMALPGQPILQAQYKRTIPVILNTPTNITCHVENGKPKPRITWKIDATPIKNNVYQKVLAQSPNDKGVTHMGIVTITAQSSDAGRSLACGAWNEALQGEEPYWTRVTLDVRYAPKVQMSHSPTGRAMRELDHVTFTCTGRASTAELVWKWYKDDQLIPGENRNSYDIRQLPREYHGSVISCEATNSVGSTKVEHTMSILYAPKVQMSHSHTGRAMRELDHVTFTCTGRASTAELVWKWYKDEQLIPGENCNIFEIQQLHREYHGSVISCEATNSVGITKVEHTMNILYGPRFVRGTQPVTSRINGRAELECETDGNPPAEVTWFRKGSNAPLHSGTTYVIPAVHEGNYGVYTCTATVRGFSAISRDISLTPNDVMYTISVVTGSGWGEGTDANVYIEIFGEAGSTDRLSLLDHGNRGVVARFQSAHTDIFFVDAVDVGNIRSMTIWHDADHINPDWYLKSVTVQVKSRGQGYLFSVRKWLRESDGLSVSLQPTSSEVCESFATDTRTWQVYHEKKDIGRMCYRLYSRVSKQTCINRCESFYYYLCKSVYYNEHNRYCCLFSTAYNPSLFTESLGNDYVYERSCRTI